MSGFHQAVPSDNHPILLHTKPGLPQEGYARDMRAYVAAHPRPPRVRRAPPEPGQLRRPTSAYIHFLAEFRAAWRVRRNPAPEQP